MSVFLSLLCPGLGQVAVGRPFRGLLLFVLAFVGYFIIFFVPGLIVHLIAVYDAHHLGRRQQMGRQQQVGRRQQVAHLIASYDAHHLGRRQQVAEITKAMKQGRR